MLTMGGTMLDSFGEALNVAVVGSTGGLGGAFATSLIGNPRVSRVYLLSRRDPSVPSPKADWLPADITDEATLAAAAEHIRASAGTVHLVVVASGILHDGDSLRPEKTWRALDSASLARTYQINAIGPALVAKHLLPLLARGRKTAFTAVSARVGSISDNRLGGGHAYRASKAALNMLIRTLSVELHRTNPDALCVALHPGTVDTRLSEPFQASVPEGKLFTPDVSAAHMLSVLDGLTPEQSGNLFAWDGSEIPF